MFQPVSSSISFPKLEAEIGEFWLKERIYERSLERPAPNGPFVFYEGPPTANGMPHPGHCLTRAIKDLFPRYKTMRGYHCRRKAGWDTHGLPVEVEVCKELGIHSKEEIEAYGIEPFIQKCQQSVWRYMQEWQRLTRRIGFWVDLDDAYVTYHQSYVESVWWSLKQLFDRGLLYQGYKIVWWWAQGGTALSSGEVGQGYREVADPSVYVRFPLLDSEGRPTDESLLVWTTTPWTLPSNQFAAVHPELEYSVLEDVDAGQKIIIASALVEAIRGKVGKELNLVRTLSGKDLIGRRYVPPFDYFYEAFPLVSTGDDSGRRNKELGLASGGIKTSLYWRVLPAHFVSTESGTGIVHIAPAFGVDDYELWSQQARIDSEHIFNILCPVQPDGKFDHQVPDYKGRWVKDCDKDITRNLRDRKLLFHQEQYLHEYPFCWRAEEDPLIQYPRRSWFIKTSEFKDEMLANNAKINWLPEHIKDGRFGNFLASNVDWALSRERYWGTPLPVWKCDACTHQEAVASLDELRAKKATGFESWQKAKAANPNLPDDLQVHKPYIDDVVYPCTKAGCKGTMRRVTEVIDCWYDSGAMPFAQWGFPHQQTDEFKLQFPADFISEAIDQTRGWFYSQLAISTLLFGQKGAGEAGAGGQDSGFGVKRATASSSPTPDSRLPTPLPYPYPFRNCIVLGLMLGEDGQKMSKSKRNYREPTEIFDRYGADALRWYFFANQPPWTGIRYSEQAIKDSIPEFLLRLWNVYSFFVIYANIDGFDPFDGLKGELGDLPAGAFAKHKTYRPVKDRSELDRWIMSEVHRTVRDVVTSMDAYDNFAACARITELVDALSNWYVRRSRDRFWREDKQDRDKLDAYWTLYECLVTTAKLVAPFVPFLADALWQNLAVAASGGRTVPSVHLADFPNHDPALIHEDLASEMAIVRDIVSLGRNARTVAHLKVRQPLDKVEIVLAYKENQAWLEDHAPLIREELNVRNVEFVANADQYVNYTVLPDLKRLGPRLGKQLPALKKALAEADAAALLGRLSADKKVTLALAGGDVTLDEQDLQVRLQAKPGWAAAQGPSAVVVLSTELSAELVSEGWANELVHAIQNRRKDISCEYTDRIEVGIESDSAEITTAARDFAEFIASQTLALSVKVGAIAGVEPIEVSLSGQAATIYVKVVRK
jgi:isoleucyl-tRNA synthetase